MFILFTGVSVIGILYLTPICVQNSKVKNGIICGDCLKQNPKRNKK